MSHPSSQVRSQTRKAPLGSRLVALTKTLAWVVPLTLLIWIYAEREQLAKPTDVPFTVQLQLTSPQLSARLIHPPDGRLTADLQGPQNGINRLRAQLLAEPVVLAIQESLAPGEEHVLPAAGLVARADPFASNGIQVLKTNPPVIRVRVDQVETRELPVQPRPGTEIIGDVVFTPPRVQVRGPASALASRNDLALLVDLSTFAGRRPGKYERDLPLLLPPELAGQHISLPPGVHVTVEIKETRQQYTIRSVPVLLAAPPALAEYEITTSEAVFTNVNVSGPRERIRELEDGSFSPRAYVEVSRDDAFLPATEKEKTIERTVSPDDFRLPDNVRVIDPPRTVRLTIRRREPAGT